MILASKKQIAEVDIQHVGLGDSYIEPELQIHAT